MENTQISPQVMSAMMAAVLWHGQTARKNKIDGNFVPYVTHPFRVMRMCYDIGAGTDDIVSAAVCHDLLEDTDISLEDLKFLGDKSLGIVKELTFAVGVNSSKEEYLKSFKSSSVEALIIKVLDRIDNILDFIKSDPQYAVRYYEKAHLLWMALNERVPEINAFFGNDKVSKNIFSEIEHMIRKLWKK